MYVTRLATCLIWMEICEHSFVKGMTPEVTPNTEEISKNGFLDRLTQPIPNNGVDEPNEAETISTSQFYVRHA